MSQTEHYNDAYDGRADWSLDGRRHQAFELTNSHVRPERRRVTILGANFEKKKGHNVRLRWKKTIPSVSVCS